MRFGVEGVFFFLVLRLLFFKCDPGGLDSGVFKNMSGEPVERCLEGAASSGAGVLEGVC